MYSIRKMYVYLPFLFIGLLISCQKEPCFSCDEDIDSWAKENITKISLMSRTEIVELSLVRQQAAYRTLKSTKKKALWSEKIGDVKKMAKSNEERQHIAIFEKYVKNHDLDVELSEEQNEILFDWFEEGKIKYGWTDYFRLSAFMMMGKAVNSEMEFKELYMDDYLSSINQSSKRPKDNTLKLKDLLTINTANAEQPCDSRWCYDCDLVGGICVDNCESTVQGCGWAWQQSCNKNCKPTNW